MKAFKDRRVKLLFYRVSVLIVTFTLVCAVLLWLSPYNTAPYVMVAILCMGVSILGVLYRHFADQNESTENNGAARFKYDDDI